MSEVIVEFWDQVQEIINWDGDHHHGEFWSFLLISLLCSLLNVGTTNTFPSFIVVYEKLQTDVYNQWKPNQDLKKKEEEDCFPEENPLRSLSCELTSLLSWLFPTSK
jgi:hypothetical protein